jgi:hypothetical protein
VFPNHIQELKDVAINFNPSLVANYATENVSLVRNVILTYSISSGETLSIDGPLGAVTIDDPTEAVEVRTSNKKSKVSHSCIAYLHCWYCWKAGRPAMDLL